MSTQHTLLIGYDLGAVLSPMPGLHSLTFGIGTAARANVVTSGDPQCRTTMAKALDGAHIPRIKSFSVSIPELLLMDDTTAQRLQSMILGMKLQSFTANVERPHPTSPWACPISRAFCFMKKFRRFREDGPLPEVVFSNVDDECTFTNQHTKGKCSDKKSCSNFFLRTTSWKAYHYVSPWNMGG